MYKKAFHNSIIKYDIVITLKCDNEQNGMKTLKRNIMTVIFVFWVLPDMKTSLCQTDAGCNTVLCISHFTCISVLSASKLEQNSKILNTDLLNLIWSWAPTSSKNHRFHWKKCKKQQICVGPLNVTKTSGKFFHLNIVLYRTQGESITEKKTQDQSSNCIVPVSVPHSITELNPIETDVKNYVHLDGSLGRIILSYMSWSEKIELVFFLDIFLLRFNLHWNFTEYSSISNLEKCVHRF